MRARLALAAIAALVIGLFGAAPAHAELLPPDLQTPVTTVAGTVTADALTGDPWVLAQFDGTWVAFAGDGTTAAITLPTWGYTDEQTLHAVACPTDTYDATACSAEDTELFTPTDVEPDVTWPAKTTFGSADNFDDLVVTDPDGAPGTLFAVVNDGTSQTVIDLTSTALNSAIAGIEGDATVKVARCADSDGPCTQPFSNPALTFAFSRRTKTVFTLNPVTPALLTQQKKTATASLQTVLRGTYDLTYTFSQGLTEVTGTPVTGQAIPSDGVIPAAIAVDVANLPSDGTWTVTAELTVTDDRYSATPLESLTRTATFSVDETGPGAAISANLGTIHPQANVPGYPGSVTITATGDSGQLSDIQGWAMYSGTGTLVRTFPAASSFSWNGKLADGTFVAAGTYRFRSFDSHGNVSAASALVAVTAKKVYTRTLTRKVLPARSVVDKYVGRCSTLRKPSLRGWAASLGFYANTRCKNTSVNASLVSTVHGTVLPAAYSYSSIQVSAYGGAARAKPASKAILRYLTTAGNWQLEKLMRRAIGTHAGTVTTATKTFINSDRTFYWGFYTGGGNRYDVKYFTVKLAYKVVQ